MESYPKMRIDRVGVPLRRLNRVDFSYAGRNPCNLFAQRTRVSVRGNGGTPQCPTDKR